MAQENNTAREQTALEKLSQDALNQARRERKMIQDTCIAELAQCDTEIPEALEKQVQAEIASLQQAKENLSSAHKIASSTVDELSARAADVAKSLNRKWYRINPPSNTAIDVQEEEKSFFARGMNGYKIALIVFIGSFAGVMLELLWCFARHGYLESRSGLVWGPFNMLYGVGAASLSIILYRFRNRGKWLSFLGGFVVGSVVEYVCSWLQEVLFGSRSWDYSRVPFNIKVPRQTGGASASWVGEGAPKPVSSLAFDSINLGHTKVAGIVVMTEELVRFSNPAAEDIVRRDLVETIGGLIDKDFVDPAKAAVSGVSPASITNGVTPVVATGTTADHLRADVKTLMSNFIAANMSLSGAVWIMTETQALAIAMLLNPLGQPEFPGLSINGGTAGTFFGIPVILSENIPAQQAVAGPPPIPAGSRIILAKASEIMLADDGQVMLDASNQASLQMDNAPTNPPTATTVMVSLWQMNMVGIRAERFINWTKRRAGAVQFITGAAYA